MNIGSIQSQVFFRESRLSGTGAVQGPPDLIWFDLIWYDLSRFFDIFIWFDLDRARAADIFIWFDFDRARAAELNRFNLDLI